MMIQRQWIRFIVFQIPCPSSPCLNSADHLQVSLGEVKAILIGFWYVFFYTHYPILDKPLKLCPFMQTVMPHENHVDEFFLTHTQSPEIINFDIIFALSE